MLKCKTCEKPLIKRQKSYCSHLCRNKGVASLGGKATCDLNRPSGNTHYLWKGGIKRQKERLANYKKKYPERAKAHQIVSDAIRRGKLNKELCEICLDPKSEAHHEDYSKPLFVRWLCRKHHKQADKVSGWGAKDFGD